MNYKRIIKNRSLRLKILRLFSFVPDEIMIKVQYRIKTGRKLDIKNPKRFSEKLQWYKLYYRNPLMIKCVDKGDVRDYVKSKGLEDILIPSYGVFDSYEEINWELLPRQFVIKDTLGGGGTSVIIVKNKDQIDYDEIKTKVQKWISIDSHKKGAGREWPYYCGKKHRVIIEKYLQNDEDNYDLIDYKFFCFDGRPKFLYVIADRVFGVSAKLAVLDMDFNRMEAMRNDEQPLTRTIQKPKTFERMKEIASVLSEDFPEARIDLYEMNGNVFFGEVTFFDGSGYMTFTPDSVDYQFGEFFNLREYK